MAPLYKTKIVFLNLCVSLLKDRDVYFLLQGVTMITFLFIFSIKAITVLRSTFRHGFKVCMMLRMVFPLLVMTPFIGSLAQASPSVEKCAPSGLVVLIPGTFNSWMPGNPDQVFDHKLYFSDTIRRVFKNQGFSVLVIDSLVPTGDLKKNGSKALKQLKSYYEENCPKDGSVPIHLIGHSAGGLYGFSILHSNAELPIQNLFLIATPLEGLTLADAVFDNGATRAWFEELIKNVYPYFDARGLPALQTKRIQEFFEGIVISSTVSLWSITGEQRPHLEAQEWTDARFLPIPFVAIDYLLGGGSDGVIDRTSAQGLNLKIKTRKKTFSKISLYPETMKLDHIEQILDWRIINNLGFSEAQAIDREQEAFYSGLGDFIKSQAMGRTPRPTRKVLSITE